MDANDFLMRGGTPAVKFPTIGSSVIGVITRPPKMADVTDPASGEVKRWSNGDAKQQVVIELQTELRESEDDGGERTLWAKGQMQTAIRDAVRAAGAKGLEMGGILQVTFSGEKPTNLNPQKLFTAQYWPPQAAPMEIPPATPWEREAEQRPAPQVRPQATVAARPVSTPPTPAAPPQVSQSFLDRLRETTANQQAYHQGRNAQGQPQDEEPPF
jgi:hypothetical protein